MDGQRQIAQIDNHFRPKSIPLLSHCEFFLAIQSRSFCLAKSVVSLFQQFPIFEQVCEMERDIDSPKSTGPDPEFSGVQVNDFLFRG